MVSAEVSGKNNGRCTKTGKCVSSRPTVFAVSVARPGAYALSAKCERC